MHVGVLLVCYVHAGDFSCHRGVIYRRLQRPSFSRSCRFFVAIQLHLCCFQSSTQASFHVLRARGCVLLFVFSRSGLKPCIFYLLSVAGISGRILVLFFLRSHEPIPWEITCMVLDVLLDVVKALCSPHKCANVLLRSIHPARKGTRVLTPGATSKHTLGSAAAMFKNSDLAHPLWPDVAVGENPAGLRRRQRDHDLQPNHRHKGSLRRSRGKLLALGALRLRAHAPQSRSNRFVPHR